MHSIKANLLFMIVLLISIAAFGQTGFGTLSGKVTDATTGSGIAGAQVTVAGITTTTDGSGNYTIENIPAGTITANFEASPRSGAAPLTVNFTDRSAAGYQSIAASASGYQNYENFIMIAADKTTAFDISLSPTLSGGQYRFVLNWGTGELVPSDLDLFLVTPEISGTSYAISWMWMGNATSAPFAALDHDDQYWMGPETITIHQIFSGTYKVFVHNFSEFPMIIKSNAVVKIYNAGGLLNSVNVPTTGTGNYWYIADIDGATGTISIKNTIEVAPIVPLLPAAKNRKSGSIVEAASSSAAITGWIWDFDNNGSVDSDSQNPSHVYTKAGSYSVKLIVTDGVNNYTELKNNYIVVTGSGDATPPASVNELEAILVDVNTVHLTWSNPSDSDFAGTVIVRKTGSYPTSYTDGAAVYNGSGTSCNDPQKAVAGTTYFYAAFAHDASGNYSLLGSTSRTAITYEGTATKTGLRVTINNIAATTFPVVKSFVSIVDSVSHEPVKGLTAVNFNVKEDGVLESPITVEEITSGSKASADIVFVFDITGSMGEEISGLKARALNFADTLAAKGVDYRLALISFGDTVEEVHDFTSDKEQFKGWVDLLYAHGGGDFKENSLEALARTASLSFRAVTQKMSILITDAEYHQAGESGGGTTTWTTASMISHLIGNSIVNNVVGPDYPQFHQLSEQTGGLFFNIEGNFQTIVDLIGSIISNQYLVTYTTHNPVVNNTWRKVNIAVVKDEKGGKDEGQYFVGAAVHDVTNFQAYAIAQDKIACRWFNPSDATFAGVTVVRKIGGYPASITDGVKVYEGSESSFIDLSLTAATTYYYTAFAYNFGGIYSSGSKDSRDAAMTFSIAPTVPTTWVKQNSGTTMNLRAVFAADSLNAFTVGDQGSFLRTNTAGNVWESKFLTTPHNLLDVFFGTTSIGWTVGINPDGNAANLKTASRGNGWTSWPSSSTAPIHANDFVNDLTGWNVGSNGKIEKTIDGGATWTAQTSGRTETLYDVSFVNAKTGWAAGANGIILKTVDGGAIWNVQTSGTTSQINFIYFNTSLLGWAVTDNGAILKTANGGNTWNTQTVTDKSLTGIHFSDPYHGVAVGADGSIFQSEDGGVTWARATSGVKFTLRSVFMLSPFNGWAVGDGGTILKLSGGGEESCDLAGYHMTVRSVNAESFPLIKVYASVVDTAAFASVTGLTAANFQVTEDGTAESPITVEEVSKSAGAQADIVFVFDVTGSMGDEISGLKEKALAFADGLSAKGIDYQLGLVTFSDEVLEVHDFTRDANEFKTWIDGLVASGGGDTKENALEALARAVKLSYRATAQKIGVLITDAEYHQAGETGGGGTTTFTTSSMITLLRENMIAMNVVGPDLSQFHQIAASTGGLYFNISGDFASIVDGLGRTISSQYVITYTTHNPALNNTWRNVHVVVHNAEKGACANGKYYIGTSRLILNPAHIIGIVNNTFTVEVSVEAIVNLGLCHFFINFDKTKIEAMQAVNGDFLSQGGATSSFTGEINNTTGKIEISATRMGTTTGASGNGIVCSLKFKIINANCTSDLSITDVNLRTPDNAALVVGVAGAHIEAAETANLIGDFDDDHDIDTRDFALLSGYWKPANTAAGDIGPAGGVPPALTIAHDGVVNFEDLFVFTRMWNWYHETMKGGGLAKSAAAAEWKVAADAKRTVVELWIHNVRRLSMGHLVFKYDAKDACLKDVRPGALLDAGNAVNAFLFDKMENGIVEITLARLANEEQSAEIEGSGALLIFEFENSNGVQLDAQCVDLRSSDNSAISLGEIPVFTIDAAAIPLEYNLSQNYPNPFNHRTQLQFDVPQASQVRIEILNVLGQPVKTLVNSRIEAGTHRIVWDGTNNSGQVVVSAVYIVRMESNGFTQHREVLLVK